MGSGGPLQPGGCGPGLGGGGPWTGPASGPCGRGGCPGRGGRGAGCEGPDGDWGPGWRTSPHAAPGGGRGADDRGACAVSSRPWCAGADGCCGRARGASRPSEGSIGCGAMGGLRRLFLGRCETVGAGCDPPCAASRIRWFPRGPRPLADSGRLRGREGGARQGRCTLKRRSLGSGRGSTAWSGGMPWTTGYSVRLPHRGSRMPGGGAAVRWTTLSMTAPLPRRYAPLRDNSARPILLAGVHGGSPHDGPVSGRCPRTHLRGRGSDPGGGVKVLVGQGIMGAE